MMTQFSGLMAQGNNSYIVVDFSYRKILAENDADRKVPVASLTKVATVAVAMDWLLVSRGDKNQMMTVPQSAALIGGANPVGMRPGDRIRVRDAMFCAMMVSDNVSAHTLADHFGRQMMRRVGAANPVEAFVGQMNALAKMKGMMRTRFRNATGLDHRGKPGISTARDMAKLTFFAMGKSSFTFICNQKTRRVTFQRGGQELSFDLRNTNDLLGRNFVDGIKTGRTARAGDCLIASARKPDRIIPLAGDRKSRIPYRIFTVVLHSPNRFGQASQLLNNGWGRYEAWMAAGMVVQEADEILDVGNTVVPK
ncbi:MAG: serine hydrolase [Verrucomicrobiales bacterium]|nr:serine hydrolase [Verrucomicrobiales bacterium]